MSRNRKGYFLIFLAALGMGAFFGRSKSSIGSASPQIRTQHLKILAANGDTSILVHRAEPESPAIWLFDPKKKASVNFGLHSNGFPLVLVSDASVRNFGLGRVDGKNASPILVMRSNDIVRLVLGLSMTESGKNPFLVQYPVDGSKHLLLGSYCDNPSRVCTQ